MDLESRPRHTAAQRRNWPHRQGGQTRTLVLVTPFLGLASLVLVVVIRQGESGLDDDLCLRSEDDPASVTLLLDLQKPLQPSSYETLLRDLSQELSGHAELRVHVLTSNQRNPRILLGRLCKPYDSADLQTQTAKDRQGVRDCDDLPTQLGPSVRQLATRFCARREALQHRIDTVARRSQPSASVINAYLMEAIEATLNEYATTQGRPVLYVLVRHAPACRQVLASRPRMARVGLRESTRPRPVVLDAVPVRGRARATWPTCKCAFSMFPGTGSRTPEKCGDAHRGLLAYGNSSAVLRVSFRGTVATQAAYDRHATAGRLPLDGEPL